MMEPAGRDAGMPRAYLKIGGRTLAHHQLRLAMAMDCQRIICIARNVAPELIELQHEAERGGAQFHIIPGARGLAGLVTSNDELLVLAEGLLADPLAARALLEGSHAVLVQPVEAGLPAGFERIDLNHAMGGAMRIPGRLAEKLLDLPPDCDVPSALTRIALQSGVAMREVPTAARQGARWRLVRGEDDAQVLEKEWISLRVGKLETRSPGLLLSRAAVLAFGATLLHAGKGSGIALLSAAVLMAMALGAGWLGASVVAFALCAIAWIFLSVAGMLHDIETTSIKAERWLSSEKPLLWLLDLELVALTVLALYPSLWGVTLTGMVFAPLMLVILARLVANIFDREWSAWLRDRAILAIFLALAAGFGVLLEAIQAIAVGLGVAALAFSRAGARITRA